MASEESCQEAVKRIAWEPDLDLRVAEREKLILRLENDHKQVTPMHEVYEKLFKAQGLIYDDTKNYTHRCRGNGLLQSALSDYRQILRKLSSLIRKEEIEYGSHETVWDSERAIWDALDQANRFCGLSYTDKLKNDFREVTKQTAKASTMVNYSWLKIDDCLKDFKDAQEFDRKQKKIMLEKISSTRRNSDSTTQPAVLSEKVKKVTDAVPSSGSPNSAKPNASALE